MADIDPSQCEWMLNRFRRLMTELRRGGSTRNAFEPWEITILIDMLGRKFVSRKQRQLLRQYEKTVEKQMETGPGPPMTFSDFLATRRSRGGEAGTAAELSDERADIEL